MLSACGGDIDSSRVYISEHGIIVELGETNSPKKQDIDQWAENTIRFWKTYFPDREDCLRYFTWGVNAKFIDIDHVVSDGKKYSGLQYSNIIEISNGSPFKIRGVFIHELSHVLVGRCMGKPGNDESHLFFKEHDLCSFNKYC